MLVTMSAFPESGRSDARKWEESKGRFRPEAVIQAARQQQLR